jgi:hypothetical protein
MSRRVTHYRRHCAQRGITKPSAENILGFHRAAGKRYEKQTVTDSNGKESTRDVAVGFASEPMKPEKAARIAARINAR